MAVVVDVVPHGEVLPHRVGEQERLLEHERHRAVQLVGIGVGERHPAEPDLAVRSGSIRWASRLHSVDLPVPVEPTSATTSPGTRRADTSVEHDVVLVVANRTSSSVTSSGPSGRADGCRRGGPQAAPRARP